MCLSACLAVGQSLEDLGSAHFPDRGSVVGRAVYHPWGGYLFRAAFRFHCQGVPTYSAPPTNMPRDGVANLAGGRRSPPARFL